MSDVLQKICEAKRAHVDDCKSRHPLSEVNDRALATSPARGFATALAEARSDGKYGLIAEIKRASPSKGMIRENFEPSELARAYRDGGARCLSVLTDMPYFCGADDHLLAARSAVDLPVLRKDFMLDPYQIVEARAIGADCVLLIMAALGDDQAAALAGLATDLGMDVLVEIHDEAELARALDLKSGLIGINNRNLKTLVTDIETTKRLAPLVPEGRLVVTESGLSRAADLAALKAVGVTSFLIGEALMSKPDVTAATKAILTTAA
jgi:indole-3-glycerol phosphate synthase